MAKYVNDVFAGSTNIPRKFQVISISELKSGTSAAGAQYYYRDYVLRGEDGHEFPPCRIFDDIKANVEEWIVGMVKPGKKFPSWSLDSGIDPNKVPPSPGPTATREYAKADKAASAHDFKLGLAGVVQAMLIRGSTEEEITGIPHADKKTAEDWVLWIRNKADDMASSPSDQ